MTGSTLNLEQVEDELNAISKKIEQYEQRYDESATTNKDELESIYQGANNQLEKLASIRSQKFTEKSKEMRTKLENLAQEIKTDLQ